MYAPVKLLGLSRQKAYDRAVELLKMVGLAEKQMNYPDQMSGGQKQRVAIARALAMDPDIILFDEPTSALDPTMIGEVQAVIRELARQKKTMMIVTHEMQLAREIPNRVFYMDEGVIYEEGSPDEIFEHPKKEKTIRFMRRLKVLEIDIISHTFDFADAVNRIDQYCYKTRIPPKVSEKLQSVFEELCIQILMSVLKDPAIHVTIEYDQPQEAAEMTVEYPGNFRIEKASKTLPYAVLMANSESVVQETLPDGSKSIVKVRIK
jgi:polar amino acid transport system ATP-binding protein